jgi:hypothetical protein
MQVEDLYLECKHKQVMQQESSAACQVALMKTAGEMWHQLCAQNKYKPSLATTPSEALIQPIIIESSFHHTCRSAWQQHSTGMVASHIYSHPMPSCTAAVVSDPPSQPSGMQRGQHHPHQALNTQHASCAAAMRQPAQATCTPSHLTTSTASIPTPPCITAPPQQVPPASRQPPPQQ